MTPTVTKITTSPSTGELFAGDVVTVTLTMSEAVIVSTVDGTPTLTLNSGMASYVSGSGTNTLVFTYTVLAGENAASLTAMGVNLNGGSIADGSGSTANLSLSGLSQTGPKVLTSPIVTSVVATGNGITNGTGDLGAGSIVTLTVNFNEAVTVAGGTPSLTLNDGGTATYTGGSGTNALTFSYTVASGQNTSALAITAVNLNGSTVTTGSILNAGSGGSLTDASGNVWSFGGQVGSDYVILKNGVQFAGGLAVMLEFANGVVWQETSSKTWFMATATGWQWEPSGPAQTAANLAQAVTTLSGPLQINTASGPIVSSLVESNATSVLVAGDTVTLTLNMSEAVTVNTAGGVPTLTLNDGATASYAGGSGSNALVFTYTVAAGQNTAALGATAVNLNGATIKDSMGNAASLSLSGLTQTGPQIDTSAPKVFYVSSEIGSDKNAGTSESAPLATLQAAANLVQPGDIVEVMNGTYTGPLAGSVLAITTSGTASAPITFEAAPGQTPVIDTTGCWEGILVQGSYIVVNGFTVVGDAANYTVQQALAQASTSNTYLDGCGIIINSPNPGVVVPNHITIENNTVYNNPGAGIASNNADYLQVLNNVVYDNAHWDTWGASGISIAASVNSDTSPGVHTVISGNLAFDNNQLVPTFTTGTITDGEGIILDTNTGSTAVDPNYVGEFLVQNNTTYGNSGPGILAFLTNDSVFSGNTAYGNVTNAALSSAGETDIFANQSSNVTIANNITSPPSLSSPAAPMFLGDSVSDYVNGYVPTVLNVNGTAEAYSTITLFDNSMPLGTTTADGSGAWTFAIISPTNGSNSFTATATDSVGNVSPVSSPLALTLNVPPNLVANGNFATDNFSGWTLGGNYTWSYGQEITIDPFGNAEGGSRYAAKMASVGPATSDGTLSQTIATTAGQTYTLSFWLQSTGSGNNDFKAIWNGQTLLSLTNTEFGYKEYTYTVTATSNATTLEFSGASLNGASYWNLDNVSVAAAPVGPTITGIAESPSTGDLNAGKTVTLTLNLSSAATVVGGTPTLTLNDGGVAIYTGGSGTSALTFSYTVGASDTNVATLAATAVNLNGATIQDGSGNAAILSLSGISQTGPQIDTNTVISAISETPSSGNLNAGKVVTYTITMNEVVTVNTTGGSPTLALNDGGSATYVGGSGTNALTFSYTVLAGQNTPDLMISSVNLNGATVMDGAGNAANFSLSGVSQGSPAIDTTPPTVSSVSATTGSFNTGKTLTLTLNMSEAVTVTGTPTLTLNDGGTATYAGGSGTSALTFNYTVGAGQNTAGLAVTALNGTVTDLAGNALSTASLPETFTGVIIDTTTPSVSSVVASGSGITSGSGDLGVGSVVTLTVNMSEAVTVSGGTPTLTLNDGGTATYTGGSGSSALTFSYTVAAGQNTADLAVTAVNLNSATVTNGAGTSASLTGAVTNPAGSLQINTTGPTVSSVVASGTGITAGSGDLAAGSVVTLTVNLSSAVTVAGGTPTLTLNDGGTATYTGGTGTNALTFNYTVAAGQNTADLAVTAVNLNSATVKDSLGNAANLTGAVTNPSGTLQIDTTTPSVSSVVASGTGITSGSGDLATGSVVTLTVNLSEAVTVAGGTPSLTLNDGGTATYTGGSGSNALTFAYTVGAGQNTSDLAVTAVNLNSATVTNGAGTSASLTGAVTNPSGTLQIDTTTPTLSSIAETPSSGHLKAGKTVTFTLNMSEAVTVSGGTPTLTLNDGATATYVGGSGTSALTFSYTVGAGQNVNSLAATTINLNGATVKNGAGTTANFTTLSGLTQVGAQIDTMTPTVTQVVASPGSGTENPGNVVTLTLTMTEAVTVTGTPTLTLNDGGTATYTSGSGTNALTFSYTVGAKDSTVPTLAVTRVNLPSGAAVADAAGNVADLSGAVTTFPGLSIDPPPIVVSVAETPSSGDLGVGKTVTLTVALNDVVTVTGGIPSLSLNDGGTATYVSGSGTNALTFRYTVGTGDNTASLAATGLTLNGATIQNSLGDQAIFSFTGVTQTGPQIDGITPAVTSVMASGTGITAGSGDIPTGSVVTLTVDLSDAVTVTGGTPTLTLNNGGTATYSAGSGTNALTFTYTVAPGQSTSDLAVTAFNQGNATIANGVGVAANMSGVTTSISGTLQIDTSTHLAQVGNNYFLDNTSNSGPELHYSGAAVTAGEFGAWTPIAVVGVSGGYDVAWKNTATGQYTVWSTDGNGNYSSNVIGAVAGNSLALETIETTFNQDLNGDGTVGIPHVVIQTDGSTALTQVWNNFFLSNTGSGTGPELSYGGTAVTAGQFGAWTAIGAVQVTGGGYDVAWKNTATGQYTVWSTGSNGNYVSNVIGAVAGNTMTLEALETTFNQDLNGDGTIGITKVAIQTDGSTTLTQAANTYGLYNGGSGPTLQYGGAAVTVGEFGGWTPIGAVQVTAGGYDIAWKNTTTGQYTVWNTDNNGNYLSNVIGAVSSNSLTLQALETTFNQDLNGDGTIGVPHVVLQTDGTTALTQVGNNFFLDNTGSGTGPELSYGGAAVTAGEFGAWTPVGAVQVAGGGYDVAWKIAATGQYTVWTTDSNGNYVSNAIGAVTTTNTSLEALENTFQQDLNGDGVIGIYAAPGTTLQINSALSGPSGSATIGAGATLELGAANSSSITFASSTGMLELDHSATFGGVIFGFTGNGTLSGSDQIDLKDINFNNVHDSYSNGVLTVTDGTNSAALDFNGSYLLANFSFASDGKGGTILYDPPVTAGQQGNLQAKIMQDPGESALNQQIALLSQHMAAAFPSSAINDSGMPVANLSTAQLAQITAPIAVNQQHV